MITYTFASPSKKLVWISDNRSFIALPLRDIRKKLLQLARESGAEEKEELFRTLAKAEDLSVDVS